MYIYSYWHGIREEKTVNGSTTKYYLEGTSIVYEEKGTRTIDYLYDATGVIGLRYGNNTYLFEKNLQGDIIGIVNSNNERVATYEYDSWGKVLSIKDAEGNEISNHNHVGIINPFRYRGYYYDCDTGLYYLNSRYYNPEWCRFINADGIIGANGDILSSNLYIYVSNNPIIYDDTVGEGIGFAIFAVAVAYKAAKTIITVASNTYLLLTDKRISNDMFNKSMNNPKGDIPERTKKELKKKLKNHLNLKVQ